MDLQHINVKLFITTPAELRTGDYYGVFNGWIQQRALGEMLVDVADYGHVPNGPGLVLVGHESIYSLDQHGGRNGLLYNRLARVDGPNPARLRQALRAALVAARKLEREEAFVFDGGTLEVTVNDRLLAPNTPESFAALQPDLEAVFDTLYAGAPYTLAHTSTDPRERLTVTAATAAGASIETLLARLESETVAAR